jgi:flagellar biosynthesis protein FliQ
MQTNSQFYNVLDSVQTSFNGVLDGVVVFLPKLVAAILVFLLGWLVATAIAKVVSQLFRSIKLDTALSTVGLDKLVAKTGHTLNSGRFIGELARWFILIASLIASFDILGLNTVNKFLQDDVIGYIPQVIAAVLILFAGVIVADFLQKLVVASSKAAGMVNSNMLGSVTKWAVWFFVALTALFQLDIAAPLAQTLFTGLVVTLSLAFGLSFGLGGKEAAARYIEKIRTEVSDRN